MLPVMMDWRDYMEYSQLVTWQQPAHVLGAKMDRPSPCIYSLQLPETTTRACKKKKKKEEEIQQEDELINKEMKEPEVC